MGTGRPDELLEFLADVISRHAHNRHVRTEIDGLAITATDRPTDPRPGVSEPSLAVVVQSSERTVLGDGIFDYASGEFLVVSLDLPLIGRVTEARPGQGRLPLPAAPRLADHPHPPALKRPPMAQRWIDRRGTGTPNAYQ